MQRASQREQGKEGIGDQSAHGLTGMSFSAWFSALGRPFFLPSVLSLVAFPAKRCSTCLPLSGQPCQRSHCPGNPAVQPAPLLWMGSTSALGYCAPALTKSEILLWKAMPAPLQVSAQPLHLQVPAREMAASLVFADDPSPFIYTEWFQHSWALLWRTILSFGLEEILQQLCY